MKSYDLIIIGAGPAGMSAAVYAARKKLTFLLLSGDLGGQTATSSDVENYLGFHLVTGQHLIEKFREHLNDYKIPFHLNEYVQTLKKLRKGFSVQTNKGKYEARTLLIASGKVPRQLQVPGEDAFRGKGVSYCATCDAPVFQSKNVAVIGGGNSALDATLQFFSIAKKIFLITVNKTLTGETVMIQKVKKSPKVTILYETLTKEIKGEQFVKNLVVEYKGQQRILSVEGVFVEIGSIPATSFCRGFVKMNAYKEILIHNKKYSTNLTSVPGVYAAGDVTDVPEKQTVVAAGEGAKAVISIFNYLSRKKDPWY